jgi:hypothetical protein
MSRIGAYWTKASRIPCEATVLSWSTQPTATLLSVLPEKRTPKSSTNMTGKKKVQKSAARSRVRLFMLATVRSRRVFIDSGS